MMCNKCGGTGKVIKVNYNAAKTNQFFTIIEVGIAALFGGKPAYKIKQPMYCSCKIGRRLKKKERKD